MRRIGSTTGVRMLGGIDPRKSFVVDFSLSRRLLSPSLRTQEAVGDQVFALDVSDTFETMASLSVTSLSGDTYSVISSDPSVADFVDGQVVVHGLGPVEFAITNSRGQIIARAPFVSAHIGGEESRSFSHYVAGTAAAAADDLITQAIDSGRSELNIRDGESQRNPDCWASSFDFSCVSLGSQRPATAITARHVISADHFPAVSPVRFASPDGGVVSRQIISQSRVAGSDFRVGLLDADLPSSIVIPTLLGPDAQSHLLSDFPTIAINQQKQAFVRHFTFFSNSISSDRVSGGDRGGFSLDVVSGDSGHPIFLPRPTNRLCLAATWQSRGLGPSTASFFSEIQQTVSGLNQQNSVPPILPAAENLDN